MPSPVNSSRVIVQNLPKHTKIERFKSYFSKFTTPTDASLSYQKNGTFRNFGFIGFKTAEDAQKAVDYWNNTYFDTSKISVSLAQSAQSSDLPRPWSKHSVGSSANDKATGSNSFKVEEKVKQIPVSENDPKLNEYLNVMMPSSKAKTWANEQQLIELEVKPKNQQVEQADIVVDLAPSIAHDDKVSDMDYFKSKISHSLIEEEESISNSKIQVVDYSTTPKETRKTEPDDIPPAELIIDTGRLLIRNIPFTTTSSEITDIFSKFGPVSETHIPMNPATNTSRGYVFVLFLIPEHAVKAFEQMDGQIFQGRILTILPAREKIEKVIDESLLSFKEKKANDLKKNASTGEISWNSLFMNVYSF